MAAHIESYEVVPVAGYDSMLLNLSGAHAPYFTRNILVLRDSTGVEGIAEVPGSTGITKLLEQLAGDVVGTAIGDWKNTVRHIGERYGDLDAQGRGAQTFDLRTCVHAQTAVETALLDILGKHLDVPVAALLGDGQVRDEVRFLGYLFYIGDRTKSQLPYLADDDNSDAWGRLRRNTAREVEDVVALAEAACERYGFEDFKLKGGVFEAQHEINTVRALHERFPNARITLDPNGGWYLKDALEHAKQLKDILAYVEDPCGAEGVYSARETMAEFHRLTGMPTATNMCNTDWREMKAALRLDSVTIPLADPHFWTMSGCIRVAQLCHDFDLTWGVHSNNHFDISLAMVAQAGAAAPGTYNSCDTHWIWQDGQFLTTKAPRIEGGCIKVPRNVAGLGVELDREALAQAHQLYVDKNLGTRDDALAMQDLIPGWTFNPKRPCMVR